MKARLVRQYSRNFALYEIVDPINCRVYDEIGRDCALSKAIVGVDQNSFCGWAKGKTGRHVFGEPNTEYIDILAIKVHDDGKTNAKWQLVNQSDVNWLYHQRVSYNI